MTLEAKDFYFIRHGETDWNRDHRGMGQLDIPLNETGLRQAEHAALCLQNEPIEMICTSPLLRAKLTARIIAERINCPVLEIDDLIECGWGECEGKLKGDWVTRWKAGESIPGAETFESFSLRALSGVNQALRRKERVLIVAHGGVFWAIQKWAQISQNFDARNAQPFLLRAPVKFGEPWSYTELDL